MFPNPPASRMAVLRFPPPPDLGHPSSSHGSPTLHRLRLKPISSASFSSFPSSGRASQKPSLTSSRIPARDRVIDFGKHRGKMLGTLPSSYLTWVSKKLRARDYEEWARLADEVLQDPVYRDRLEWEAAERVLTGVGLRASSSSPSESPVAELLDISERFGWDNEDKNGWRRVDLQLLGTSKGGRIPRLPTDGGGEGMSAPGAHKGFQPEGRGHGRMSKVGFLGRDSGSLGTRKGMGSSGNAVRFERNSDLHSLGKKLRPHSHGDTKPRFAATGTKHSSIRMSGSSDKPVLTDKDCWVHEAKKPGTLNGTKVGYLSKGFGFTVGEEEDEVESPMEEAGKDKREERRERQRLKREQQMRTLRREVGVDVGGGGGAVARGQIGEEDSGHSNPFPGRGALLDKIRGRGAF